LNSSTAGIGDDSVDMIFSLSPAWLIGKSWMLILILQLAANYIRRVSYTLMVMMLIFLKNNFIV
jgi:hypothetical protein